MKDRTVRELIFFIFIGWTPLHEVASNGDALNIVKALLEHGANPNVPGGKDNFTPLVS